MSLKLRGEAAEVVESYRESLTKLIFNDKIVISHLTEVANENRSYASIIVQLIEERLQRVPPNQLLPHLYLIDSICKNHGLPFKELFQQNLVSNFAYVFAKVDEKTRALMYKLRHTWTQYNIFSPAKLNSLDRRIQAIDPNWPILPINAAQPAPSKPSKILINPAKFPQQQRESSRSAKAPIEDETEKMRAELLKKEKELLELKKKEIDLQLAGIKAGMKQQQQTGAIFDLPSSTTESVHGKLAPAATGQKAPEEASRDPRMMRDPRMRARKQEATAATTTNLQETTTVIPPAATAAAARPEEKHHHHHRTKSEKSPAKKSSSSSSSSSKERDGKTSTSSSSNGTSKSSSSNISSRSSKSSSSSSSKSSNKTEHRSADRRDKSGSSSSSSLSSSSLPISTGVVSTAAVALAELPPAREERQPPSPVPASFPRRDKEQLPPLAGTRKRDRELSPAFSLDGDEEMQEVGGDVGRISAAPPAPSGRIPKLRKAASAPVPEEPSRKRSGDQATVVSGPPPDKRPKPIQIDLVGEEEEEEDGKASPAIGWAKHKQTNPDQFRTPVKESGPFFGGPPNHHPQHQQPGDGWLDEMGPDGNPGRGGWYRGRGFRRGRGPFHPRPWMDERGPRPFFPPMRGAMPPAGMLRPFGRGGAGGLPQPPFGHFAAQGGLPGLPGLDLNKTDPEVVRKEVIPTLIRMGQEGRQRGKVSEEQFREFMSQVMLLNESSLIREAERRSVSQENIQNKENRLGGGGGMFGRGDRFPREMDDGPPVAEGGKHRSVFELEMSHGGPPGQRLISPHKNDLPLADPADLAALEKDPTKSMSIDGALRPIRHYGETATIVLEDDRICELSFQSEPEPRRVIIDDSLVVFCPLNAVTHTEFKLKGVNHRIKIGNPSRELWVDGEWYDCYFNTKIRVKIGSGWHSVLLDGPLPSVKIGAPRPDLCRGRVFLLVDAKVENRLPIYLDSKPQLVEVSGKPHVLRFVEGFRTVTINGHPFRTDFGGFPMVISVGGQKHYLRLTNLPPSVELDLEPAAVARPVGQAPPTKQETVQGTPGPPVSPRPTSPPEQQQPPLSPPARKEDPLSQLLSLMPSTTATGAAAADTHYNTHGHVAPPPPVVPPPAALGLPDLSVPPPPPIPQLSGPAPNINDLWARLQSSGVLSLFGSSGSGIPGLAAPVTSAPEAAAIPGLDVAPPVEEEEGPGGGPGWQQPLATSSPAVPQQRIRRTSTLLREIQLVSHHPSLKERQQAVVDLLFGPSDLQCKNCGLRFSPEDMTVYSAHLDWHFRAKRRERDNARKAQSRRWYYEKNDWIVSDEIEDDEQELTEEEIILEQSVEIPTIPVRNSGGEEECPVCLEQFNQVYKQGEGDEEGCWHLHNAMRDDTGTAYHPECFKDKEAQEAREASLAETTVKEEMEEEEQQQEDVKTETPQPTAMEAPTAADATVVPKEEEEPSVEPEPQTKVEPEEKESEGMLVKTEAPETGGEAAAQDDGAQVEDVGQEIKTEPGPEAVKEEGEDKSKEGEKEEEEGMVKMEEEEERPGNTSLILDAEVGEQTAVIKPQQKVDIKLSITSQVTTQLDRRESSISLAEEEEEAATSEFDPEAIVVPARPQEEREAAKPKLRGRRLVVLPPQNKDSELSGLCSIM